MRTQATPAPQEATPRRFAPLVLAALVASGCAKSYVAASFRPPDLRAGEAQAYASAALDAARPAWRTVAVRAPWGCTGEAPAAAAPGMASRGRALVESRCEIWLGELEKALAAHFRVVGWRALARAEQTGAPPRLAAQASGADLVLDVSELTVAPLWAAAGDPEAVLLQEADAEGKARGPASLSDGERAALRELFTARHPDGGLVGVRVAVDLAALPPGGEVLWRYRQRFAAELGDALETRMLLRGRSSAWRPVAVRAPSPAGAGQAEGAEQVPSTPQQAPPAGGEDPVRARARQLASSLAADAVALLAGNRSGRMP